MADPLRYGIILAASSDADRRAVSVADAPVRPTHVVVNLTKVGDDELVNAGFRLAAETRLRVIGLGEIPDRRDPADYGWIVDAKTRARVWTMAGRRGEHAGGGSKNRLIDEVITLPKGEYIAYYQTDGSHAYGDWNSEAPYDPDSWGLTIAGAGDDFNERNVTAFAPGEESGVIAQLIKAKDGSRLSRRFALPAPTKVRVYAIGEGQSREMADYGWITDARTGRTVWEMTYGMTERAGGAKKNRLVDRVITLEPGEYELHYECDDSHAFNDWNDDPPEDPVHWGISLYRE